MLLILENLSLDTFPMPIPPLTYRTSVLQLYYMKLKWLSTRDLVGRPGAALKSLPRDGAALITSNGKPRALLLAVDENSFMDDVTAILGFLGHRACSAHARNPLPPAAPTGATTRSTP
jgi:hypothetical protein